MNSQQDLQPWEQLYRYWLGKHVDGHPPRRTDIDPMIDLANLAPNLIMVDYHPAGSQYRLVGSGVVSRFGMDNTGKLIGSSGVEERQLNVWRQAIESAARAGKPGLMASRYPGTDRAKTVGLILPLAPDPDGVVKLVGATFFDQPYPNADAYEELEIAELLLNA